MYVDVWIEGLELSFVDRKILVAEVTYIYRTSAILSELMGGSTANAEGRIGS